MAYAATITVDFLDAKDIRLTVDESDVSATDEATIDLSYYNLPAKFRIYIQESQLLSGAGATVDPILMQDSGATGDATRIVVENETAGVGISNNAVSPIRAYTDSGFLYHQARPDAGADNVIRTVYHIRRDWEG